MKKRNYLFVFLLITVFYKGQLQDDFLYFLDRATRILYNDPEKSLIFTQDLIVTDKNPENLLIYQNLIAQSYALKGDYLNSVKSSLGKGIAPAAEITPFHQLYLDYSLADQYQNLGFYKQSEKVVLKILAQREFPKNAETPVTLGRLFQLQAVNSMVEKKSDEALKYLDKSDAALEHNNQESIFLKIENQLFRGNIYLHQNKMEQAKLIFDQVSQSKIMSQSKFLYALTKESISRMYFLQQQPKETVDLLLDALQKIEDAEYEILRNRIYEGLAKAYLAENNQTQYHYYRNLQTKLSTELNANKKSAINFLVSVKEGIDKEQILFYTHQSQRTTQYIGLFVGILLLGSIIVFVIISRKEKDLHKQVAFFEHQLERKEKEKDSVTEEILLKPNVSEPVEQKKSPMLSPEKEQELLEKLREFENSQRYLSNQMSLPSLASELGTNIKYLSEIIREKKNKKFNSYINHLRIQYIVHQLQTDPAYLKYKVSHLAEVTGFSSHSAFTSVFKAITGMSPNEFIQQLTQAKK